MASVAAATQSSTSVEVRDLRRDCCSQRLSVVLGDFLGTLGSSEPKFGVRPGTSRPARKGRPINIRKRQISSCRCMFGRDGGRFLSDNVSHHNLSSSRFDISRERIPGVCDLGLVRSIELHQPFQHMFFSFQCLGAYISSANFPR